MTPKATVRLIYHRIDQCCTFYLVLEEPLIRIIGAWSAMEGDQRPCEIPSPPLVLVDSFQADSGWAEVTGAEVESVQAASTVATPAPATSPGLSIEATDHGTFDLLANSFTVLRSGLC